MIYRKAEPGRPDRNAPVDPGVWEPIRHYLGLLDRLECTETDDLDDTENLAIALRIYAIALERRNELRRKENE